MKSNLYSSYKVAFAKLEQRLTTFPCSGAYFHFSTQNEKTVDEIKELHPSIDIYNYGESPFCQLRDINRICEEQIEIFLNNNQLEHYNNIANVNALRISLESIICSQIISIHANNHRSNGLTISEGAYYFIIPLENFRQILTSDPTAILNEDYFLFLSKELINHYYLEFCQEIEDEDEEVTEENKNKLAKYLMEINALDKNSIIKFIQSLLPHREVKLNSIWDFKYYNIHSEDFKDAFLQILHELSASDGKIGENLTWKDADNSIYTATAINNPEQGKNKVCRRIFDNISTIDIEVPYESDVLITTSLEVDSLESLLNPIMQVDENTDKKNNVTKWSKISLTTLENAKNRII